jgi:hypothetical protein
MIKLIFFVLVSSCGVNILKPIEAKNTSLEQNRLEKQINKDPNTTLEKAKEKLPEDVQKALTKIEKLIAQGTAYEDIDQSIKNELVNAIPQDVKEAFKGDNLEDEKNAKIIKEYSAVMMAYSKTATYSDINFIDTLSK